MKKVWVFGSLLLTMGMAAMMGGCNKNDFVVIPRPADTSTAKQAISLFLSGGYGSYDSVLINIKSVSVLMDTCDKGATLGGYYTPADSTCSQWIALATQSGQYNIGNALDTLLASGTGLPPGKVKIIKLVLGNNNYFVKNGTTYPLQLFSGDTAAATISLRGNEFDTSMGAHNLRLWVDFNTTQSIVTYKNAFYFSPFLGYFVELATGNISGTILPPASNPIISIYNATDTAYTTTNNSGFFSAKGLAPGSYSMFINAANGYSDTTIANIVVRAGYVDQLGTITLHK
jgi:hypothetical protein